MHVFSLLNFKDSTRRFASFECAHRTGDRSEYAWHTEHANLSFICMCYKRTVVTTHGKIENGYAIAIVHDTDILRSNRNQRPLPLPFGVLNTFQVNSSGAHTRFRKDTNRFEFWAFFRSQWKLLRSNEVQLSWPDTPKKLQHGCVQCLVALNYTIRFEELCFQAPP